MGTAQKSRPESEPRPRYLAALDERLDPEVATDRAEMLLGALLGIDVNAYSDDEFAEQVWWSPQRPNDAGEVPTSYRVSGFTEMPETMRETIQGLARLLRVRADQLDAIAEGGVA